MQWTQSKQNHTQDWMQSCETFMAISHTWIIQLGGNFPQEPGRCINAWKMEALFFVYMWSRVLIYSGIVKRIPGFSMNLNWPCREKGKLVNSSPPASTTRHALQQGFFSTSRETKALHTSNRFLLPPAVKSALPTMLFHQHGGFKCRFQTFSQHSQNELWELMQHYNIKSQEKTERLHILRTLGSNYDVLHNTSNYASSRWDFNLFSGSWARIQKTTISSLRPRELWTSLFLEEQHPNPKPPDLGNCFWN